LTAVIIQLASQYRHYGYRRITPLLHRDGWRVNHKRVEGQKLFIEPGSPWENGYVESCNEKLRDELLNRELFATLWEVQVLVKRWRRHDNQIRPHRALKSCGHPLLKRSPPSTVRK